MVLSSPFSYGYKRSALRQLRSSPKREQIINLLDITARDPFRIDDTIKALKGSPDCFRRRYGDWRVSYQVDAAGRSIDVFEIAARSGRKR